MWTYEIDDPKPYRWSAAYADLPFSVEVGAVSETALGIGKSTVEPAAPDEIDGE
jgi:hypothetical protein